MIQYHRNDPAAVAVAAVAGPVVAVAVVASSSLFATSYAVPASLLAAAAAAAFGDSAPTAAGASGIAILLDWLPQCRRYSQRLWLRRSRLSRSRWRR